MAFYAGMAELANRPYRQRRDPEAAYARRRERERDHRETWSARARYNERCEQQSAMFEQFTSPRYYAENNKLHEELRAAKEKAERLEARRSKLRQLLMEEAQTHELEAMMARCTPRAWEEAAPKCEHRLDAVPVELLKEVNEEVKANAEARRKQRAEASLYEQWRRDSAQVRDAERRCGLDKIKMSWLDQQIEKRVRKEREEEEALRCVHAAKLAIETQRREEAALRKEAEEKRAQLRQDLEAQMGEVARREAECARLRAAEESARLKGAELQRLEDRWEEEERRRRAEETALANQRHHRQKLHAKAQEVSKQLEEERAFIRRLQEAELCDKAHNEQKRLAIQKSMNEFLALVKDLKQLEEQRRQHMQFAFDSEAPKMFEQFDAAWRKEEELRKGLVTGILKDLKSQIEDKVAQSAAAQKALAEEREATLQQVQKQREEIDAVHEWEERKKQEYRKCLDQQVAEKRQKERQLKEIEKDKRADELNRLRCEETRLKEEILRMQRGQPVATHGRRRFFY